MSYIQIICLNIPKPATGNHTNYSALAAAFPGAAVAHNLPVFAALLAALHLQARFYPIHFERANPLIVGLPPSLLNIPRLSRVFSSRIWNDIRHIIGRANSKHFTSQGQLPC
jgi:hypothetical protein